MSHPAVPFADLHAQYVSIRLEVDDAIRQVIASSAFIRGPFVEAFEREFAERLGVAHCVSCANGTDSLYIAFRALDVAPGDEVIVPAHSWISTSETVTQSGATVVFCDTDRDTFTIDPELIESKITSKTVGIVPVHLYGQPADMDRILAIAAKHKLWVLEDCAQAHLARYKGRLVGTMGVAGSFSFYPGKNLGAMGDAGALVTADAVLAQRMATFARHGGRTKGEHLVEGINSRLDGLQAAILSVKLKHLDAWTRARRELAAAYSRSLRAVPGLWTPVELRDREHVYHLYVVRHDERSKLVKHLAERNIQTVINYPIALPFLPAYSRFGHTPSDFPIAYENQSRILSLPIFAEMTQAQFDWTVESIASFSPHQ